MLNFVTPSCMYKKCLDLAYRFDLPAKFGSVSKHASGLHVGIETFANVAAEIRRSPVDSPDAHALFLKGFEDASRPQADL